MKYVSRDAMGMACAPLFRRRTCFAFMALFAFLCMSPSDGNAEETLRQAMIQAYKTNPGFQAEQARLRATDEGVAEAMSNYRPNVSMVLEAGKMQDKTDDQLIGSNRNLTPKRVGFQVTQPLFRGFRTTSQVQGKDTEVLMERAKLEAYEQTLLLNIGQVYLDLVRDTAVLDLLNNHIKVLHQQVDTTQDRLDAGLSTETDMRQAESRLESARAEMIKIQGDIDTNKVTYKRLSGLSGEKLTAPELSIDKTLTLEDVIKQAELKNPHVKYAQLSVDRSKFNRQELKGNLLPEVNLVGSVAREAQQSSLTPGRRDVSQIMLQVRIPLYGNGADYARVRAAAETSVQQGLELQDTRNAAHEKAVRGWKNYSTAQARITSHNAAVRAAKLALKGVEAEQKAGSRTTIDVLNAEQEVLSTYVNLAESQHDRDLSVLQIKEASGNLTLSALGYSQELYNPEVHYQSARKKWVGF